MAERHVFESPQDRIRRYEKELSDASTGDEAVAAFTRLAGMLELTRAGEEGFGDRLVRIASRAARDMGDRKEPAAALSLLASGILLGVQAERKTIR